MHPRATIPAAASVSALFSPVHRVSADAQTGASAPAVDANVMLTPSTGAAEPSGAMNGVQLIDDLDRPATSPSESSRGQWVVAPIPFRNELLGAGYLYGARETRHTIAAAGSMYAEGDSWAAVGGHPRLLVERAVPYDESRSLRA
jgi:hypothetical protein